MPLKITEILIYVTLDHTTERTGFLTLSGIKSYVAS